MKATNSIVIALMLGLGAVSVADAALFIVNETLDNVDATPGNGVCAVPFSGNCSLRAAVQEANAWPGKDFIQLPAGYFQLTRQGVGEDFAATGDLDILEEVVIFGAGWEKTVVSGGFIDRVFDVAAVGLVELYYLQVRYGSVDDLGGGIRAEGNLLLEGVSLFGNLAHGGVGLENAGTTTLESCEVAYNYTTSTNGGAGIRNIGGSLTVRRSSIHHNGSTNQGGGIYNYANVGITAVLLVDSSTISDNSPDGIYSNNSNGPTQTTVVGSTIADNGNWGLRNLSSGTPPVVTCSIVSGHSTADCNSETVPPISGGGFNLNQDGSCSYAPTDLVGNPLLGPFAGSPLARAPRLGSPVIDGGANATCPVTDQLGRMRPLDGDRNGVATSDIGALEDVLLHADGFESGDLSGW
ncbi:MAG: right-handed parallel beta-helix repeat-containing protein [Thermoanaerobaculia bacterium]|nr:right-handed parallel beta-helix repeat-containing protein [Thermoanaerobaculia bacterium]